VDGVDGADAVVVGAEEIGADAAVSGEGGECVAVATTLTPPEALNDVVLSNSACFPGVAGRIRGAHRGEHRSVDHSRSADPAGQSIKIHRQRSDIRWFELRRSVRNQLYLPRSTHCHLTPGRDATACRVALSHLFTRGFRPGATALGDRWGAR
jgi:hypothetical protein